MLIDGCAPMCKYTLNLTILCVYFDSTAVLTINVSSQTRTSGVLLGPNTLSRPSGSITS